MHLVLLHQSCFGSALASVLMVVFYSSEMLTGHKLETIDVKLVMTVGLNQALQQFMFSVSAISCAHKCDKSLQSGSR